MRAKPGTGGGRVRGKVSGRDRQRDMRGYRPGRLTVAGVAALAGLLASTAPAEADSCRRMALIAARHYAVPMTVMDAIAAVESGYNPWAVHHDGSHQFESPNAAGAYIQEQIAAGETNIDIGCMQINWHWHQGSFASPIEALRPMRNVLYAARYLRELRASTGSWSEAVASYHSPTPERRAAYQCRVALQLVDGAEVEGC